MSAQNDSQAFAGLVRNVYSAGSKDPKESFEEKARACRNALFLTDPHLDRESLISTKGTRIAGTCEWITQNKSYQSWLHGSTRLLWISGSPGKGKTMLSIFLAEELERVTRYIGGAELVFYFCSHQDEKRNSAVTILRGLVYQIIVSCPKLVKHVLPYFDTPEMTQQTLSSLETLWIIFGKLIQDVDLGTMFCVLDGLDECDEGTLRVLVPKIVYMFSPGNSQLTTKFKLVIISRDMPGLRSHAQVKLDLDNEERAASDIEKFVSNRVEELSRMEGFNNEFRATMQKTLLERSQGTFLWVDFIMNELFKKKTCTEVLETLQVLPRGLPETTDEQETECSTAPQVHANDNANEPSSKRAAEPASEKPNENAEVELVKEKGAKPNVRSPTSGIQFTSSPSVEQLPPSELDQSTAFVDFDWTGAGRGNHVDFARHETVPLAQGRFLGQGISGPIYETTCIGCVFAWKTRFCPVKIREKDRKELNILKKLNHWHIIKIAGSYTHHKHLGLLLFPVAVCDLSALLDDFEKLNELKETNPAQSFTSKLGEETSERLEALGFVIPSTDNSYAHYELLTDLRKLLFCSMGCLISAIAYLHGQSVRHKDLKPPNVLLTLNGLFVTDFGTSTDFSLRTSSATENGERGTPKYFAPEVAAYEPSGRAADMFSLGCILVEIAAVVGFGSQASLKRVRRQVDRSFQANLDSVIEWLPTLIPALSAFNSKEYAEIVNLIAGMLQRNSAARPTISKLLTSFSDLNSIITSSPPLHGGPYPLFGDCCLKPSLSHQCIHNDKPRMANPYNERPEESTGGTESVDILRSNIPMYDSHQRNNRENLHGVSPTPQTPFEPSSVPIIKTPAIVESPTAVSFRSSRSSLPPLSQLPTPHVTAVEEHLLGTTYAHELIYDKEGQILGGSLPALVEQLTTHESTPDAVFVAAFYLTFRLFTTPVELTQCLIDRFDYIGDSQSVGVPVRLRVYNVFKGWLECHWVPDSDSATLGIILSFATGKLRTALPAAGKRLAESASKLTEARAGALAPRLVLSLGKMRTFNTVFTPSDSDMRAPIITKSQLNALKASKEGKAQCSILDFDPLEMARQFTLIESKLYCSIKPEELLALEWTKRNGSKAVNVRAMPILSNDLANLVADTILHLEDAKKRAIIIKQWVKIAVKCLELNNYDSLMAIICSLNSSMVLRLKKTWELVSARIKTRLEELKTITDVGRNYEVIRQRLQNHVAPCIPFIGIYLTDLTFVDVGCSTTRQLLRESGRDSVSVINFDKHMKTAKIIGQLQSFQVPYRLAAVPEMQEWMESQLQRVRPSDQANVQSHHRRSLLLEPRVDSRTNSQGKFKFLNLKFSSTNSIKDR